MDQAAEILLSMMREGVSTKSVIGFLQILSALAIGVALWHFVKSTTSSALLQSNTRLNEGSTWLRVQRLGGQTMTALYLKRTLFKVYLWNADTGDLIEESTIEFLGETKCYMDSRPDSMRGKDIPSASMFGL